MSRDSADRAAAARSTYDTPEPILTVAAGFMAAKHLFAASELGLFEALADAPATLEASPVAPGSPRGPRGSAPTPWWRSACSNATATPTGTSPTADRFLAGASQADLRPLLRFWDRVSYPAWQDLAGSLGRGPAAGDLRPGRRAAGDRVSRDRGRAGRARGGAAHTSTSPLTAGCWTSAAARGRGRSPPCGPIRAWRPPSSSCRSSRRWPRPGSPRPGSATGSRSSPAT